MSSSKMLHNHSQATPWFLMPPALFRPGIALMILVTSLIPQRLDANPVFTESSSEAPTTNLSEDFARAILSANRKGDLDSLRGRAVASDPAISDIFRKPEHLPKFLDLWEDLVAAADSHDRYLFEGARRKVLANPEVLPVIGRSRFLVRVTELEDLCEQPAPVAPGDMSECLLPTFSGEYAKLREPGDFLVLAGIMQRAIILGPVFNRSYSRPRLTGLVLHNYQALEEIVQTMNKPDSFDSARTLPLLETQMHWPADRGFSERFLKLRERVQIKHLAMIFRASGLRNAELGNDLRSAFVRLGKRFLAIGDHARALDLFETQAAYLFEGVRLPSSAHSEEARLRFLTSWNSHDPHGGRTPQWRELCAILDQGWPVTLPKDFKLDILNNDLVSSHNGNVALEESVITQSAANFSVANFSTYTGDGFERNPGSAFFVPPIYSENWRALSKRRGSATEQTSKSRPAER